MTDVTIRWAGPADAVASSTYKIERSLDNAAWTVLAAAQASTSPYASVYTTLASNTTYGVATVALTSATSFSSTGYGWIDDALIQWTGKSVINLTGVVWHSGYGTYAAASAVYEAHESYADTGITISLNAVLYRITHTVSGLGSPPAYLWYYSPPVPASNRHCVVIVPIGADLGVDMQAVVSVQAYLASDAQFSEVSGQHLDSNALNANLQSTNAFGLAFFQCWRDSARFDSAGGVDAKYTFVLKPGSGSLTLTASTIPDRDWVLLSQII